MFNILDPVVLQFPCSSLFLFTVLPPKSSSRRRGTIQVWPPDGARVSLRPKRTSPSGFSSRSGEIITSKVTSTDSDCRWVSDSLKPHKSNPHVTDILVRCERLSSYTQPINLRLNSLKILSGSLFNFPLSVYNQSIINIFWIGYKKGIT